MVPDLQPKNLATWPTVHNLDSIQSILNALAILECSESDLVIFSQVLLVLLAKACRAHSGWVLVLCVAAISERLRPLAIREVHHGLLALGAGVAEHNPHLRAALLNGPAVDLLPSWRRRRGLVLFSGLNLDLVNGSLHDISPNLIYYIILEKWGKVNN